MLEAKEFEAKCLKLMEYFKYCELTEKEKEKWDDSFSTTQLVESGIKHLSPEEMFNSFKDHLSLDKHAFFKSYCVGAYFFKILQRNFEELQGPLDDLISSVEDKYLKIPQEIRDDFELLENLIEEKGENLIFCGLEKIPEEIKDYKDYSAVFSLRSLLKRINKDRSKQNLSNVYQGLEKILYLQLERCGELVVGGKIKVINEFNRLIESAKDEHGNLQNPKHLQYEGISDDLKPIFTFLYEISYVVDKLDEHCKKEIGTKDFMDSLRKNAEALKDKHKKRFEEIIGKLSLYAPEINWEAEIKGFAPNRDLEELNQIFTNFCPTQSYFTQTAILNLVDQAYTSFKASQAFEGIQNPDPFDTQNKLLDMESECKKRCKDRELKDSWLNQYRILSCLASEKIKEEYFKLSSEKIGPDGNPLDTPYCYFERIKVKAWEEINLTDVSFTSNRPISIGENYEFLKGLSKEEKKYIIAALVLDYLEEVTLRDVQLTPEQKKESITEIMKNYTFLFEKNIFERLIDFIRKVFFSDSKSQNSELKKANRFFKEVSEDHLRDVSEREEAIMACYARGLK